MPLVRCEVKGVFVAVNDETTVPLVLLTNGSRHSLPIFIGLWEAVSINSARNREVLSRPFTHDLFLDLLNKFSITLHSMQIDNLSSDHLTKRAALIAAVKIDDVRRVARRLLRDEAMTTVVVGKPVGVTADP